ncbi:hypothetical protein IFM89_015567 [Coptis chinensis]|uniref:Uncharacterized protein n=1 Tax=Coptis chinensis TaxID=261450 RepID=A0A835H3H0_9MAGN|nr:hypothetical protein IFM89_015567 [Coptis chinensis]
MLLVFLTAKKKLKVLSEDPPPVQDAKYEDLQSQNSTVMTWLWSEPSVSANVMYMKTAKGNLEFHKEEAKGRISDSIVFICASIAYSWCSRATGLVSNTTSTIPTESSALVSGRVEGGCGSGRGGRGTGRSFGRGDHDSRCTHCGRFNHTEEYCWDKWGNLLGPTRQ